MTPATPPPGTLRRDEVDVDLVAAAVRGCPAVDDLDEGLSGSAATYLPGRRVIGVRIDNDRVYVQVRARWGITAGGLGRQVRSAVLPLAAGRAIDVNISDIAEPGSLSPATPPFDLVENAQPLFGDQEDSGWTPTNSEPDERSSAIITPTVGETPIVSSPD